MNKEAWLVFRNGGHKLQWMMKDGFGHVAVLYADKDQWVLIAPNEYVLEVIILDYKQSDNAPQWLANSKDFTILKVTYEETSRLTKFPRLLIGFTCVSFVKYFLGYKDCTITPYGLYKSLHKLKRNIIKVERLK